MNNKGQAMLLIIGVIMVLAILGTGYALRIFNENSISVKNVHSTQAFWISEAGIQKSTWDYTNNQCHGMKNAGNNTACVSCTSCGVGNQLYTGTLGSGEYSVSIDMDTKTFISTGSVWRGTGPSRKLLANRKIKVFFGRDYIFGYGAFSQGALTIANNSLIDSYNSNNAAYSAPTAGTNGNVGTNGTSVNVVDIENNSTIKGSVSTGPGGTVDYKPSKVTITNGISHSNDVYLEPVSIPTDVQAATYLGNLNVSGTTDLSSGTYKYGTLSIGNNGTLNINGDVIIYVNNATTGFTTGNNTVAINIASGGSLKLYSEGKIDFGNKATITNNTTNNVTSKFMIYSKFTGSGGISLGNKNDFLGAIYAPQTDINIGNTGGFYGSAVGKTVNVGNNGQLHYDESLAQQSAPWQPNEPRDWQEQFD
jgi:hypothetical protein